MIFVTVGTHEQQFDRLIKEMDRLKKEDIILDEVFIQTGYSNYIPTHCEYKKMVGYDDMQQLISSSDVVVTHGGPATFMSVIAEEKKLIVVPRLKKFGEHVNDHQLDFVEKVKKQGYPLDIVIDISNLEDTIKKDNNYEQKYYSNNMKFNNKLSEITISLLRENHK